MLFQCLLQGGHVSHYHERMSRAYPVNTLFQTQFFL